MRRAIIREVRADRPWPRAVQVCQQAGCVMCMEQLDACKVTTIPGVFDPFSSLAMASSDFHSFGLLAPRAQPDVEAHVWSEWSGHRCLDKTSSLGSMLDCRAYSRWRPRGRLEGASTA